MRILKYDIEKVTGIPWKKKKSYRYLYRLACREDVIKKAFKRMRKGKTKRKDFQMAHRELTGCTNENILDLARYLDEIGKPVWIRHVLVPERSDYDEYLIRLDEFLHSLHNVQRVEVLPYHTLGVFKWETLGIPYKLEGINPPTKERVENANKLLHTAEYTGYLK